jgi:hypothetical protein
VTHQDAHAKREQIKREIWESGERIDRAFRVIVALNSGQNTAEEFDTALAEYLAAAGEVSELRKYLGFGKMVSENEADGGPPKNVY